MTAGRWLIGFAPALAATAPVAAQPVAQQQPSTQAAPDAARKISACEGEKFEFKAGEPRPTKITLCSDKGATTADLVRMFESAADKIQKLDKLPKDRRDALVAQLRAKVVEVRAGEASAGVMAAPEPMPGIAPLPGSAPMPEYSQLPPLPLPAPRAMPERGPMPEYAQLPPMPSPVRTPVVAQPLRAPAVALAKPRLTIECSTPGQMGADGPCVGLEKDTLLTIRAGENLAAGTSLRFVRKGDVRSELALAQMRKGQSRRIRLPLEVCTGVVSSRVEIQILRSAGGTGASQMVDSRGPYQLRC